MGLSNHMTTGSDHRIFQRFSSRLPAKIKDSRDGYGHSIHLRDTSAQGAGMLSRDRFYVNDSLAVDVDVPGSFPLTLKGSVVWASKQADGHWDIGLKFHQVNLMKISRLYEKFVQPSSHK
jgi:hypothetical protein